MRNQNRTSNDAVVTETPTRTSRRDDSVARKAAERVHATVDRLAENVEPAEYKLREKAAAADEKLRGSVEKATRTGEDWLDEVRDYASKNPLTAAGAMFAAGMLVSSLLRR